MKSRDVRCSVCGNTAKTRTIRTCSGTGAEPHTTIRMTPMSVAQAVNRVLGSVAEFQERGRCEVIETRGSAFRRCIKHARHGDNCQFGNWALIPLEASTRVQA